MIRLHVTYRRPIPAIEVRCLLSCSFDLIYSDEQDWDTTCWWGWPSPIGRFNRCQNSGNTVSYHLWIHTSQAKNLDDVSSFFERCIPLSCTEQLDIHSRMSDRDAQDVTFVLSRYWNRVDINRIPEQDMNYFTTRNPSSQLWWLALKRKYGM